MKSEAFLRVLGQIDDDLILEAAEIRARRVPAWIRPVSAIAACAVLAVGILAAGPLLWKTGSDSAAEFAPAADEELADAADGFWDSIVNSFTAGDKKTEASASAAAPSSPSETGMVPDTVPPDTGEGVYVTWRTFRFCEDGVWRRERREYPDGLPSMQTIVNDYLAAAGSEVRCSAADRTVVGEKDEVIGDIVVHTVGVTTWTVTLDGDPGEDIRRGLTNTVLDSGVSSSLYQVVIRTPETEYPSCGAYSEN